MNISDLDNHGNRFICRSIHGFGNNVNQSVIILITMVTMVTKVNFNSHRNTGNLDGKGQPW